MHRREVARPRRQRIAKMRANGAPSSLDPADWQSLRAQGHRMLDDIFDYVEHIRERPVWQPIPDGMHGVFHQIRRFGEIR